MIENPVAGPGDETELQRIDRENREADIVVTLDCELFEFYNGAIKLVNFARKAMLSETQGSVVNADSFNVVVVLMLLMSLY